MDDSTVITQLDGGSGFDTFQIGQIFGTKRNSTEGALLPNDTFPVLIPTTRGWLSPGPHAPMVVNGGTGNDEFTVYSNQAELRLEGDDDNDLFVVRAFAIATVVWGLVGMTAGLLCAVQLFFPGANLDFQFVKRAGVRY